MIDRVSGVSGILVKDLLTQLQHKSKVHFKPLCDTLNPKVNREPAKSTYS